jgi:hypothetical protein
MRVKNTQECGNNAKCLSYALLLPVAYEFTMGGHDIQCCGLAFCHVLTSTVLLLIALSCYSGGQHFNSVI